MADVRRRFAASAGWSPARGQPAAARPELRPTVVLLLAYSDEGALGAGAQPAQRHPGWRPPCPSGSTWPRHLPWSSSAVRCSTRRSSAWPARSDIRPLSFRREGWSAVLPEVGTLDLDSGPRAVCRRRSARCGCSPAMPGGAPVSSRAEIGAGRLVDPRRPTGGRLLRRARRALEAGPASPGWLAGAGRGLPRRPHAQLTGPTRRSSSSTDEVAGSFRRRWLRQAQPRRVRCTDTSRLAGRAAVEDALEGDTSA